MDARFAPAGATAVLLTAPLICDSRLRLRKNDIVKPMQKMRERTAAVAKSTRRRVLVLVLAPLAPMAARSASSTSLKKWLRNSHCGTFRLTDTRCWGAAAAADPPAGTRNMAVASRAL